MGRACEANPACTKMDYPQALPNVPSPQPAKTVCLAPTRMLVHVYVHVGSWGLKRPLPHQISWICFFQTPLPQSRTSQ